MASVPKPDPAEAFYPRRRRHSSRAKDAAIQLRAAEAVGISAQAMWDQLRDGVLAAARRGRWKHSEIARALGEYRRALVDAYGRERTRFLRITPPKG